MQFVRHYSNWGGDDQREAGCSPVRAISLVGAALLDAGYAGYRIIAVHCDTEIDDVLKSHRSRPVCRGETAVLVQMELARIIINDVHEQQVVYLREIEAENPRAFPILIGIFEAASINRHVKGEDSQRPLTH